MPKQSDEIVYIGGATVRKVKAEDWEAAGIKDQADVEWSKPLNSNRVKVGDLSKEALDYLLTHHSREFVVATPGEKAPLPVDQPNPPAGDVPAPNGQ